MDKLRFTREDIIKQVAKDSYTSQATVRSILDSLEQRIFDNLSLTSEEYPNIIIRLFEGINFETTFVPEKLMKNNLTGKDIKAKSKIKLKVNVSRTYGEKLSEALR